MSALLFARPRPKVTKDFVCFRTTFRVPERNLGKRICTDNERSPGELDVAGGTLLLADGEILTEIRLRSTQMGCKNTEKD